MSGPSNQDKSPPAAPEPPGKSNVPVRPKNTAALLQRENQRKAEQTAAASAKESQMKASAVTNLTSNTGPIRPEANKQLTEYKSIFDAVVETTVKKYIKYDDELAATDPTSKKDPSYPLTSFALVFNNNFNWKANTTDPEYPISSYNLQLKLPALTRIYETRRKLHEAATKIMAKVNEYVTKIIDEQIRIGDVEGTKKQRALLLEIIELLKTSEFNDATSEKIFTGRIKNGLSLNINEFYMNEIWRHLIKPYGDIKRFVEAIINPNSTIRKQIDESIRGKKPGILSMYKATTTAILGQIGVFLEEDNTQNTVFNENEIAIAFDILFLPSLFKRKDIATIGLGKNKKEYENTLELLKVANSRISEFFKLLDAKNKIFIGFKKLLTQDNEQIIADFKRLLCDDAAKQLYSEDIGKNLPQGELRENVLKLFKLIRETFEQECIKCSTLLNCSGPKLVTFLEKSKEIKGLLDGGLRGGIIGSVTRVISDLEGQITNVIKTPAFSFDLYGVNTTFTQENCDKIKEKLSGNTSEKVTAKLQTDQVAAKGDAPEIKTQMDIYSTALQMFKGLMPSFSVKEFNSVSMEKQSDASLRAADVSRREIDAAAAAESAAWFKQNEIDKAKAEAAKKTNLETTSVESSVSSTSESSASPLVEDNALAPVSPATPPGTALAAADTLNVQAGQPSSAASSSDQPVNPPASDIIDVNDVGEIVIVPDDDDDVEQQTNPSSNVTIPPTDVPSAVIVSGAKNNNPTSASNDAGIVGGKTRRNKPKSNNKQTRKQNKVIYKIPHKSSSYNSKNGRTNSAKSKNTRRHK